MRWREDARGVFKPAADLRGRLRRIAAPAPAAEPAPVLAPPLPSSLRIEELRRFKNLLFAARVVVEGFYAGRHRSPYHDFSAEFADFRPYVPGDEIRAVDWRAVARTDRLYVKLYRKETDMSAYLLVDRSNSMGFAGEAGTSKLEYARHLAMAVSYLMLQQGDRPGIALASDTLDGWLPPGGSLRHLQKIASTLERAAPAGQTRLAAALRTLFPLARRRGLLLVIDDLLEDPEDLFRALGMYSHRGFAILLFQVLADEEMDLPALGAARFTDPEGPAELDVEPESVREAYRAELNRHLAALESGAKARGIRYHLVRTSAPLHESLSAYLSTRGR